MNAYEAARMRECIRWNSVSNQQKYGSYSCNACVAFAAVMSVQRLTSRINAIIFLARIRNGRYNNEINMAIEQMHGKLHTNTRTHTHTNTHRHTLERAREHINNQIEGPTERETRDHFDANDSLTLFVSFTQSNEWNVVHIIQRIEVVAFAFEWFYSGAACS